MPVERQKEIRRRRQRKLRLNRLKQKLAETKDLKERERLIALIRRRAPFFETPQSG